MKKNDLGGKRGHLLELIATRKKTDLATIMEELYGEKESAKKALEYFSDQGWINLEGFGNFSITGKGYERYCKYKGKGQGKGNDNKFRRLDTF